MPKPPPKTGFLVTFEGTEGAGKSTLIRKVEARLRDVAPARGVVVTREPGGSTLSEKIRSILLEEQMSPWTELFLYEAARAEHLERTVLPALLRGDVVLCDRFTDSTLAYQAYARGLPWKAVTSVNRLATQGRVPALTVLLDVDPEVGLARATDHNRFEREGLEFQKRVRRGFLKARSEGPSRWLVLKAGSASPDALAEQVMARLGPRLGLRASRHA